MEWKLAEAKNKFSEVVRLALAEGPQRVRRRNDAVVIMAEVEFDQLTGKRPGFKEFLTGTGPDFESLDLSRDRTTARIVDL
jgi:prevent-host-death family protein